MKNAIVVGSGVAGTVLARRLLETGEYRIRMLEAGPAFKTGDRRLWLDHMQTAGDTYAPFIDDPRDDNELFGLRGSRLFMQGGTTNHWGGLTPRFKPEDFELYSRTGYGVDWPISYEDLAPYYTKAEHALGITGDSDNDDPPRYGDKFPFAHTDYTMGDKLVIEALESLDLGYGHMALARNGDRCITTGTCDYCPVSARYAASFDNEMLRQQYPDRFELLTEVPVTRLLMKGKLICRGVEYLSLADGETHTLEAEQVFVSCGTIESCKLLLASANPDWPEGIGNDSGHVGRHLLGHPVMFAAGVRPGNSQGIGRELGFGSLISRHFDTPEWQRKGKMWFSGGVGITDSIEAQILDKVPRAQIRRNIEGGLLFDVGGEMEQFEKPENRVRLGNARTRHGLHTTEIEVGVHEVNLKTRDEYLQIFIDVLKAAGCTDDSIETGGLNPDGAHASATCRMSQSDADGVVDPNLQVHGTDNLYVCSNAVFPSIAAANPTLTVSALAIRLAEFVST